MRSQCDMNANQSPQTARFGGFTKPINTQGSVAKATGRMGVLISKGQKSISRKVARGGVVVEQHTGVG